VWVVTEVAYPWQTGAGTSVGEDEWQAMARRWMPSGVVGATSRDTADTSLLPTVSGGPAGPTFSAAIGEAWVAGVQYSNTAPYTKTGTINGSADPRIDRLVLKMDKTAKTIVAVILPGTPAAVPLPPSTASTSNVNYLKIGRATVTGGGNTYTNMVDERTFTATRHYVGPSAASGLAFMAGDTWYQTDTDELMVYDGTSLRRLAEIVMGIGAVSDSHAPVSDTGAVAISSFTAVRTGSPTPAVVGKSFVVPRSGKVKIVWACGILTSAATNLGNCGIRVATGAALGTATGTDIVLPDLNRSIQHSGTLDSRAERSRLVDGLTPGDTCHVTVQYRANTGSATFSGVEVSVYPQPV
jgi:hypothetical protein